MLKQFFSIFIAIRIRIQCTSNLHQNTPYSIYLNTQLVTYGETLPNWQMLNALSLEYETRIKLLSAKTFKTRIFVSKNKRTIVSRLQYFSQIYIVPVRRKFKTLFLCVEDPSELFVVCRKSIVRDLLIRMPVLQNHLFLHNKKMTHHFPQRKCPCFWDIIRLEFEILFQRYILNK
jgi:hypothetical protein